MYLTEEPSQYLLLGIDTFIKKNITLQSYLQTI